jgi:uncharacterized protein (DUF4213/DUF364 family)
MKRGAIMPILDDLLECLVQDAPVRSVLVGTYWTVVCSRHCGMAATLRPGGPHGHDQVRDVGHLHEKSALELAEYARSNHPLEVSIGVAAINSLIEIDKSTREVNAVDVLAKHGEGKKIALVGHFPFIPKLIPAVEKLWVIEKNPTEGEYPAEAASELIPQADVVAITGSALLNRTLDALLALCRPGVPVMVLGPSTPLSPVLFAHGATILSGVGVVDENTLLRTVGQGATFQQVEGVMRLTLTRDLNTDK